MDKRGRCPLAATALAVLAVGCGPGEPAPPSAEDAEQAVVATLARIFDAFVAQDRATLAATHAADWSGLRSRGETIASGLDEYLDGVSFRYPMLSYEIEQTHVQLRGRIAVLHYTARYVSDLSEFGGTLESRIRATDVYELGPAGSWVQIASNLAVMGQPGIVEDPELGEKCLQIRFVPN